MFWVCASGARGRPSPALCVLHSDHACSCELGEGFKRILLIAPHNYLYLKTFKTQDFPGCASSGVPRVQHWKYQVLPGEGSLLCPHPRWTSQDMSSRPGAGRGRPRLGGSRPACSHAPVVALRLRPMPLPRALCSSLGSCPSRPSGRASQEAGVALPRVHTRRGKCGSLSTGRASFPALAG